MSFKSEFDRAVRISVDAAEKTIRAPAIQMFSEIIKQTPVDTGRMRGNWQTSVNSPAYGVIEGIRPEAVAINEVTTAAVSLNMGEKLYMANNLPYAYRISQGWSSQRPSGWIENIISTFQAALDKKAREQR